MVRRCGGGGYRRGTIGRCCHAERSLWRDLPAGTQRLGPCRVSRPASLRLSQARLSLAKHCLALTPPSPRSHWNASLPHLLLVGLLGLLPLLQVFTRAPFLKPMMDRVTSMVPSTEKLQYGAWGEFMMPADGYGRPTPMELRGKFMTNVGQFSGNYLSFGSGLSVLAIFFHPFLLFLGIGLFFGFRRAQSPEPMVLMGRTLSGAEKSTGMVAIAITTILVTGALGACGGGSGGSGGSSFSSCSCYCWWRRRKGRCWWLCCCCLLPLLRGGTGGEGDRCCHTPAASTDTRARCWRIVSGPWRTLFHIIIFQRRWSGSLDSSA